MTNYELFDSLGQLHSWAERLHLIALSSNSYCLNEFLEELEDDELLKLFPSITIKEWNQQREDNHDFSDLLLEYSHFGFIAEIRTPHMDNFRFKDDGSVRSFSVNPAIMSTNYVYCETIAELTEKLKEVEEMVKKDDLETFKLHS